MVTSIGIPVQLLPPHSAFCWELLLCKKAFVLCSCSLSEYPKTFGIFLDEPNIVVVNILEEISNFLLKVRCQYSIWTQFYLKLHVYSKLYLNTKLTFRYCTISLKLL